MNLLIVKIYRTVLLAFILIILSNINLLAQASSQAAIDSYLKDLPFKMDPLKEITFPEKYFEIVKYGAIGDGLTKNTVSIQNAIDECSQSGGGYVVVPAGIWLTGPIQLKSNVNLNLKTGALLLFSKDVNDYDLNNGYWEGRRQFRCQSPISGYQLQNIAITGNGIIDGSGEVWRPVKKNKMTEPEWQALIKTGVVNQAGNTWYPTKEAMDAEGYVREHLKEGKPLIKEELLKMRHYFRPVMISLIECKNILLDGPVFQNSPAWNNHPLMCENMIIRNVTFRNPWYSQNGDGIDVESSKNVLIYKCTFDVGDDALCMKSGIDAEGRKRGMPTENIVIADCIVFHGHGGFTIGSEMSGGVKNIKVCNCNFIGTDIGLRFKSTRGRGGVVENIFINDIYMKDIPTDAVSFNMYYSGAGPTEEVSADDQIKDSKPIAVNDGTPIFRKIYLNDIYCNGARNAVVLQGLPEMPISEIELNNIVMKADKAISLIDADGVKITNAKISSSDPVVRIIQSKNVTFNKIESLNENKLFMKLDGAKTGNIIIKGVDLGKVKDKIEFGNGVSKNAVTVE
jgi:polygalacturonase